MASIIINRRQAKLYWEPINLQTIPMIVVILLLASMPHFAHIPIWQTFFAFFLVAYKLIIIKYSNFRPNRIIIIALAIIAILGIGINFSSVFGRDSGISLLIVMLYLKLLEARTYRDGMVLILLTYFLAITNFFLSQSIAMTMLMLFTVFAITITLVSLNQGPKPIDATSRLKLTSSLLLYAAPITLVLFILFPRIPGPLWGMPENGYGAKTGLSDTMSPGQISNLATSDEPAFRVKFQGLPPPSNQLYWRAIVFWDYDGRTWRPGKKNYNSTTKVEPIGKPTEYTVTLEPHQQKWIFALDMPFIDKTSKIPIQYQFITTNGFEVRSTKPVISLAQYRIKSYREYSIDRTLKARDRARALKLPKNLNPKTYALAQQWLSENQDPKYIINKALELYNKEFTYTLRPPPLNSNHAIDEYLFSSKRGFCEHFASSFVYLLRAAGIPARIVTGYQGGEINPIGNYMLVRQADAHAWSEVWLEDKGWIRIDPTQAVSPTRIEQGLNAAIPASENSRYLLRNNNVIFAKLSLFMDSINNHWNEWMLGYDLEMQKSFLSNFGFKDIAIYDLILWLSVALSILLTAIVIISLKKASDKQVDSIQKIYLKLCNRLGKLGYLRKPHEGPMQYLARIRENNIVLGEKLSPIFSLYTSLRYGPSSNDHAKHELKQMVRNLNLTAS